MRHDLMNCQALGCTKVRSPAWLMCRDCWELVPSNMQMAVYRTVKTRGKLIDASWAPWWRAQARAIAHVAHLKEPDTRARDAYLAKEIAFADSLEGQRSIL